MVKKKQLTVWIILAIAIILAAIFIIYSSGITGNATHGPIPSGKNNKTSNRTQIIEEKKAQCEAKGGVFYNSKANLTTPLCLGGGNCICGGSYYYKSKGNLCATSSHHSSNERIGLYREAMFRYLFVNTCVYPKK